MLVLLSIHSRASESNGGRQVSGASSVLKIVSSSERLGAVAVAASDSTLALRLRPVEPRGRPRRLCLVALPLLSDGSSCSRLRTRAVRPLLAPHGDGTTCVLSACCGSGGDSAGGDGLLNAAGSDLGVAGDGGDSGLCWGLWLDIDWRLFTMRIVACGNTFNSSSYMIF